MKNLTKQQKLEHEIIALRHILHDIHMWTESVDYEQAIKGHVRDDHHPACTIGRIEALSDEKMINDEVRRELQNFRIGK